jgi:Ca2+-binding RTX toxin-like protein
MSTYNYYGPGNTLFKAFDPNGTGVSRISDAIISISETELRYRNGDGSETVLTGQNFEVLPESIYGLVGTVTGARHYSNGVLVDEVTGANASLIVLNIPGGGTDFFESQFLSDFAAGDTIDASSAVSALVLNAQSGDDIVTGSRFGDKLYGGGYNDTIRAGAGNDQIYGDEGIEGIDSEANDRLFGEAGNDRIIGNHGDDTLDGGSGNDLLMGGSGNDALAGGSGIDAAVYALSFADLKISRTATGFTVNSIYGRDTLTGIERIAVDDGFYQFNAQTRKFTLLSTKAGVALIDPSRTVRGTTGDDVIDNSLSDFLTKTVTYGLDGKDKITGSGYSDLIFGGDGDDAISGNSGLRNAGDRLYGEGGNDRIEGTSTTDLINGGDGYDILFGRQGDDRIVGGAARDTAVYRGLFSELKIAQSGSSLKVTSLTEGTDTLIGIERIAADDGIYQRVAGSAAWTRLADTPGELLLHPDRLVTGTTGDDTFGLSTTADRIVFAGTGDDTITADSGVILAFGEAGNDTMTLTTGRLFGGTGDDVLTAAGTLVGGTGNDTLVSLGTGTLYGDDGTDTLKGSTAAETFTGGAGADTFIFVEGVVFRPGNFVIESWGADVITDFVVGIDRLQFDKLPNANGSAPKTLSLTNDGWLVSSGLTPGQTILLEGVTTAGLTLGDLIA